MTLGWLKASLSEFSSRRRKALFHKQTLSYSQEDNKRSILDCQEMQVKKRKKRDSLFRFNEKSRREVKQTCHVQAKRTRLGTARSQLSVLGLVSAPVRW